MTAMSVGAGTPFTVHDLEGMPDDGRRYEVIDDYAEVARVSGDDAFRARRPFPVDVVPAALLGRPCGAGTRAVEAARAARRRATPRRVSAVPTMAR